jgi:hypothetical protein
MYQFRQLVSAAGRRPSHGCLPGERAALGSFVALAGLLTATSCSSQGSAQQTLSFAAQPDMVETGMNDALRVAVRASPDPPWQGTIAVALSVTNTSDGSPVDGLTVTMVPWMPAHGHGTSLTPVVTAEGGGKYLVTDVDLFMAGYWALQTSFSGPTADYVAPGYNVP